MPINTSEFSPSEKMISNRKAVQNFSELLAETCHASRLSQQFSNPHEQTIWNVGTNIIGPTFFMFVWWTLEQAQQQNIKRLYFLGRDGQILLQVAQIILKKGGFATECKYLHGSRMAWLIPAIQAFNETECGWILSDWWNRRSIRSICKRLGIVPQEIKELLNNYGFTAESFDRKLSITEKTRLKACLQSPSFQTWFNRRSELDYENTLGFFRQEGLLDDIPYGLVDVGWKGNQQASLNRILTKSGHQPSFKIQGFYLGLIDKPVSDLRHHLHGFLFDLSDSLRNVRLCNNHLYEAFAASTQGRVIRFAKENNRFQPVCQNPNNTEAIRWGVKLQQESILKFCQEFIERCPRELLMKRNYASILNDILYRFIENPQVEEAETYGQFPMDGEMTESRIQEIAPVVTRLKFWKACSGDLKNFNLFWVQASLLRSKLFIERRIWKIILPLMVGVYFSLKMMQSQSKKLVQIIGETLNSP